MKRNRRRSTLGFRGLLPSPRTVRRIPGPRLAFGGERLEDRRLLASDTGNVLGYWHNNENPFDVNADGKVSVMDALWIVNDLNANGPRSLTGDNGLFSHPLPIGDPADVASLGAYPDVNNDDQVTVMDVMAVVNQLANEVDENDLVQFRLAVTDLSGTEITSIQVGQQFQLRAFVMDLRTGTAAQGVFSAYMDVTFQDSLVDVNGTIQFADPYTNGQSGSIGSGVLDEVGAFDGVTPLGAQERMLFRVTLTASAVGTVLFTADPADSSFSETGLYGLSAEIADENISFGTATVNIVSGTQPTISVNDPTVAEGNSGTSTLSFTVSLSAPATSAVSVAYATANGTATAGQDYTATSGTLNFAVGEQTKTVNVTVSGDTTPEASETVRLLLSNAVGATISDAEGTGTITNDDGVAISVNDPTVVEGNTGTTTLAFTVSLSAPATAAVTVAYATANGTAIAGTDYTATSGTLNFAAGEQTKTVNVTVTGDTVDENDETVLLNLSNATGGATIADAQGTGTITDDDGALPTISVSDPTVTEGNSGTTTLTFTVTLSAAAAAPVSMNYATRNGSATAGLDYTAANGSLGFSVGETSKTVNVTVLGDTLDETNETVRLVLSNLVGANFGETEGLGTIIDDDEPGSDLTVSVANISLAEGTATGNTATFFDFTVRLSRAVTAEDGTVSVNYATANGTAIAGTDFLAANGTLTFAVGEIEKTVQVQVRPDSFVENDEYFLLDLSNPSTGWALAQGSATATIEDDEADPVVFVTDVVVNELTNSTGEAEVTIAIGSGIDLQRDIVVSYTTINGTAIAGQDYTAQSGTVTIRGTGETPNRAVIRIPILSDGTASEPDETFIVRISNAIGGHIDDSDGTVTILDHGGATNKLLRYSLVTTNLAGDPITAVNVGQSFFLNLFAEDLRTNPQGVLNAYADILYNSGLVEIDGEIEYNPVFTAQQSGNTSTAGTIDEAGAFTLSSFGANPRPVLRIQMKALAAGSATFSTNEPETLSHFPGLAGLLNSQGELQLQPVDRAFYEGTTLTIGATRTISVADVSVTEGNSGTTPLTFTVTMSSASTAAVTINYSTGGGTATAGADYVGANGSITFEPGQTSRTITINVNGDTLDEINETFELTLTTTDTTVSFTDSLAVGTITDDDAPPVVSIANASHAEGDSGTASMTFTLTLSAASGQQVSINAATQNGTAIAGEDFNSLNTTVTFAPGETTKTVTVGIRGDLITESDETFTVNLSSPVNATVSTTNGSATGTITNDDSPEEQPGTISGTVFLDLNNNGTKDSHEMALQGVTVRLRGSTSSNQGFTRTATTDASGNYSFTNVPVGSYYVFEDQPNALIDGRDLPGSNGNPSMAANDVINITLTGAMSATGYNFAERGLKAEFIDKRLTLASVTQTDVMNMIMSGGSTTPSLPSDRSLSVNDPTVTEGNSGTRTLAFTVTLSSASTSPVTVNYATQNGTATAGQDYTAASGTLTFAPGETTKTVNVTVTGDTTNETNETIRLVLSNPSGAVLGDAEGTGTISNDDGQTLSVNDPTVTEGNSGTTTMTFTVSLSAPATSAVSVNYATADGTATAGQDYTATSGTLNFAVGEQTKTVTVTVTGDTASEPNETVRLVLSNATGATISDSEGAGTITNDDQPSLSVNDPVVTEGNSGTATLTFTVSLSAAATGTVTVNYATADGTATAGQDYTATSGTLTFNAGETSKTVSVTVNGDTTTEANETVKLVLSNASGATIGDAEGSGTITNDDGLAITVNDPSVTEGNSGTTTMTFTVMLSAPATSAVSVAYATANGTATAGTDYTATSGTLNFAVGEQTKTVTVSVTGDTIDENNETVLLNLTNATGATIADTQGTGTITDDDVVTISVNDPTVTEGNSGTTTLMFTVSLSAPATSAVTVAYATANGTATAGTDYTATSGTLNFAIGEQTKTVAVTVSGDTTTESNETVLLNLSNATGATIADAQGSGTITNDDGLTIAINDQTLSEGNSATSTMTFTVSLSAAATSAVTVAYTTQDITATSGVDYNPSSGTLTFNAGEQTKSVTVTILGDTVAEATETFRVMLSNATGATITDAEGIGTITNDDGLTISVNDPSVAEGNSGTATMTFTVSLTAPATSAVNVAYATANGTATAGSDYTATSGTLNFNSGEQTKTVSVSITGDTTPEANETVRLLLSNAVGATISDAEGTGTITNDDGNGISVSNATVTEGNSGTANLTFTVSLTIPATNSVGVAYATANGTATAGTDYTSTAGTLNFAVGEQTKTVIVPVAGDTTVEPDETVFLNLSSPTGATIVDGQGTGTITNDDLPTISVNDPTVAEGNSGTTTLMFTVTLSAAASGAVSVNYATANGTATAGQDYTETSGTLTFAAGETSKTVSVVVTGDTTMEPNETVLLNLSNASGATIADNQGTGTITNDDLVEISVSDPATVTEGDTGTTTMVFTVTLSAAATQQVTVDYATEDGGATAGQDYTAKTGTLTFAVGETSKTVEVVISGDTTPEADETLNLLLSGAVGATIADGEAVGVIENDDGLGVSVGDATVAEGNTSTAALTFTISLTEPATAAVSVDYAIEAGTATVDVDYDDASGTVGFAVGEQTKTITIMVIGDTTPEADETLSLVLSNATGATIVDGEGTGTIENDDGIGVAINDAEVAEGNTGTATLTFTVSLSEPATSAVSVQYLTANGSAGVGQDYTASSGTLNFAAGEQTKMITVTVNGDTTPERDETLFILLSNATGASIIDNQGQGTIRNDDSVAVTVENMSITEGDDGTSTITFTLTIPEGVQGAVTVAYSTDDVTATAGQDYVAVNSTLTFEVGETSKTVEITVHGDMLPEADETFMFRTASSIGSADMILGSATGTIENDDGIGIRVDDESVTEGNDGTVTMTFTVSLTEPAGSEITVDYTTANGTATAGEDYTAASGTLTFMPGEQTKTVDVLVTGDTTAEDDETLLLLLSDAMGATITDGEATGTINDDDGAAAIADLGFEDAVDEVLAVGV